MELSYSRISTYNVCPRKYKLRYHDNYEAQQQDTYYLDLGTAVHKGLETAYSVETSNLETGLEAIRALDYDERTLSKASDVLTAYWPVLSAKRFMPVLIGDKLSLEYYFDFELEPDVQFRGYVDAILADENGELHLFDWKTRGRFVDYDAVNLDAQLFVYVYVMRDLAGLPIKHAAQVQMSTSTPGTLSVKQAEVLRPRKNVLKSTVQTVIDSHDLERSDVMPKIFDKVVSDDSYIRFDYIDLERLPVMIRDFQRSIDAIRNDKTFRRVASGNVCKWCEYNHVCFGS